VVNFAASWMNFEEYCEANPDPEVQLQSQIAELENKLAERETVINSRRIELAEARKRKP